MISKSGSLAVNQISGREKSEMKLPVFVSGYLLYNYMYWLRLFVDLWGSTYSRRIGVSIRFRI